MSRQPESRLQLRIRKRLQREFPGSWWIKFHGGPFTPAGVPDLIGCVLGRFFFFEVKIPGEEASVVQVERMKDLRAAGAMGQVVCSEDEAIQVILHALTRSP